MGTPAPLRSVSTWKAAAVFEHEADSHVSYKTDARLEAFPRDSLEGPTPMELLLGALAGCTGIDLVSTLAKMRLELRSLRIAVEGEREEEHPRVFRKIRVTYDIETDPADPEKVLRAVELSAGKYCSVSAMLACRAGIEYTLRSAGREHHGVMHGAT